MLKRNASRERALKRLSSSHVNNDRLWMLMFLRDWLTISYKSLDMQTDCILSHCNSLFESLSLSDTSRESWYSYSIPSLLCIRVQYDSVLILAHSFILQIQSNSRSSCAVSPACSRIEDSVFGLIITFIPYQD